ncbi:MAG: hypothetical protein JWO30_4612 [Fibrobacteres bacterium]|nr:hypothetical protein [Fibrobacterota bacterium]
MKPATPSNRESGFALIGVIGIMVVLAILGTMVYQNVNTDITHSGKDVNRVRAEFAAESAVQWALAEVARKRPGNQPFSLATHTKEGTYPMPVSTDEDGHSLKLDQNDIELLDGAHGGVDKQGWIYQTIKNRELSVSNAKDETLSFKVWYPDDSTLRIQGRGEVDGSTADVDLMSRLRDIAIPM